MQIGLKQNVKNLQLRIGAIAAFLARITPACKEMTRLLSESMDRSLPLMIRVTMRLHILICKWCKLYQHQLLFVRNAVQHYPEKVNGSDTFPPTGLSSEAEKRLKEALRQRR